MSGYRKARNGLRLFAWFCVLFGLLFGSLELASPQPFANAMDTAEVSLNGPYTVDDLNGSFDLTVTVLPTDDTAIAAVALQITYDPALVMPVLNTDPNEAVVNAPACTLLNSASAACGPPNPNGTIQLSIFRTQGAWPAITDVLTIPFVAVGVEGTAPLGISLDVVNDISGNLLPSMGIASSVTVALPTPTPTPTATPTPLPTSTPTPLPTATPTPLPTATPTPLPTSTPTPLPTSTPTPLPTSTPTPLPTSTPTPLRRHRARAVSG